MNMDSDAETAELDAGALSRSDMRARLLEESAAAKISITNTTTRHDGLAAGFSVPTQLLIQGDVGDFLYLAGRSASVEVTGSCGHGCGYSMSSGSILIRGTAGDFLAAYAQSGFVGVHGAVGDYCGYAISGADVVVRSRCGDRAGCGMSAGDLVLCKGAGQQTGLNMTGGTIFMRGTASFADGVRQYRMKGPDAMRLSLLLARAGIKGDAKEFKVYRSQAPN